MSDNLNFVEIEKFKDSVGVSNNQCLKYVSKQCVSSEDIIFTVHIGYDCLRGFHEAKQGRMLKQQSCTYVQFLNILLGIKYCIKVKDDCSRLEGRLRRACGEINKKFKGKTGASYRNLMHTELKLALRREEVVTIAELETQRRNAEEKSNALLKENELLTARCEELYSKLVESTAIKEKATEDLIEANAKVESLFTENEKLHAYIKKLGENVDFGNNGKTINETSSVLEMQLTMSSQCAPVGEDLPRSYLIKQCKDDLNKMCHITRTPGAAAGAQLDFDAELESVLKKQIHLKKIDIDDPDLKVKIKISGDGAKMSRLTSFITISFSVLNNDEDLMSSKGNNAVAVIKGHETYELLQSSCSTIFRQVNHVIDKGKVSIEGKDIPVDVFLGRDYKFLLLVLGMKSASSDYSCIWCEIHAKDRFDMTKPQNNYWEDHIARKLDGIIEDAKKKRHSCEHQPLLNIPLENVILDELHLMLRITDRLTGNLVKDALEWDNKENFDKPPSQQSDKHLQALVKAIKNCGVSFNVWEKLNGDGKGSGLYAFTSLMGSDKKLLLKKLPDNLQGAIRPETSATVTQIWRDFDALYKDIGQKHSSEEQASQFFEKARDWIILFTSLAGKSPGYEKKRVTPYMHAMVYHIPRFMTKYDGIKKFTGQGVEKLNDDCRRIHLQRSNKWDAPKDILLVGKRMEHLSEYERASRKYRKQEPEYWNMKIHESRAKRPKICTEPPDDDVISGDLVIDEMTAEDVKARLKNKGITTRLRSLKKLKELLLNTLRQDQIPIASP
ncbi:hypothetical protein P5673_028729 [Acropora cervicornis]|uniref:Uncharacterized protein n=1 Tax=Acropora cervicornis TaxID=6130 RepID=A0AAD9PWT2_ACRCE|nr:hypothetical protein P5673_028729 [Acropora cervicornis]